MHTLILSDTHLGNGGPYDIFAGEVVLPALLDRVAAPGLHILFNGDTIDFLLNDDPLALHVPTAIAQASAVVAHPGSAAVLHAIGRALKKGADVTIRLGNHDIELALPEVHEVLRAGLGQKADVAARLAFQVGDMPSLLRVGGATILCTHGEQQDPWNRVDYEELLNAGQREEYRFSPGSRLVKHILNPLKRDYHMRFADLLKPDFTGAFMAALAVNPSAVKAVNPGEVAALAARVFARSFEAASFGDDSGPDELIPMEEIVNDAGLDEEELETLAGMLDDGPLSFSAPETELRTSSKLLRRALMAYANAHRAVAGHSGDAFFSLDPTEREWKEAGRLAEKFGASAVIFGHTHAARWRDDEGLVYANTGTWIGLMRLPDGDAPVEAWLEFLTRLKANPGLDPKLGETVPVLHRFTWVEVAEDPAGGARVELVEWKDETRHVLGGATVKAG